MSKQLKNSSLQKYLKRRKFFYLLFTQIEMNHAHIDHGVIVSMLHES